MNETDLKAIKELLDQQAERLEKRMIHVFNEGFEQVVFPHIMEIKEDISSIKDDVDDLKHRNDRMERKLDAVVDYQDRQGQEIKAIKKFIRMPEGA
jgi:ubiquinone biosynthesis protein UbiJ